VVFAHDTNEALRAAVTLVNTQVPPDTLETVEALDTFLDDFQYTGRRDGDEAELQAVRRVRPRLRELLTADRDHAVTLVNDMLRKARAVPQLRRHSGYDWHVHAIDDDAPLCDRIIVETAMAMVDVIRSDEMSRLGICADHDCGGLVLDLSRNRSRRFCSTACGNRNAVAAYRARQAAGG
jgi:predicted RNA-binding Zn ribbon-like protein